MHSRQLQYTVESFTTQQEALCHSRKFCCIAEKLVLQQKLEKSSFCSRNWRKVPSAVEIEDKPTLQCLPLDLDSTFVHNLVAAKCYFEAYFAERQARLPSQKKKRKKNPRQSLLTFLFVVYSYEVPKAQKQIQGPCGGCHEAREDHR